MRTFAGWVYCAFVIDVFSRRVVGSQVSTSLRTDLSSAHSTTGLARSSTGRPPQRSSNSSYGCSNNLVLPRLVELAQYVAIRYTERLAEAGAVASVGSKSDSYENAMAEAFNSLFKAELVRNRGPWKNIADLEIAVAEYIDRFSFRRLHGEIGLVPPVEYETQHRSNTSPERPAQREFEAEAMEEAASSSIKPGT